VEKYGTLNDLSSLCPNSYTDKDDNVSFVMF